MAPRAATKSTQRSAKRTSANGKTSKGFSDEEKPQPSQGKPWYGMPAYAKDGNVICFFQNAGKFKVRYRTLGFNDKARLDDDAMWPNSYALIRLTPTEEAKITALVKRAVR
jgi:hypothetical protein